MHDQLADTGPEKGKGWSNTARYQHIVAAIRRDVATKVGGLLWKPSEDPRSDESEDGGPPGEAPPTA